MIDFRIHPAKAVLIEFLQILHFGHIVSKDHYVRPDVSPEDIPAVEIAVGGTAEP